MQQLIIYLHTRGESQVSWLLLDQAGQMVHQEIGGPESNLAEYAKDSRVTVLLPAERVLITSVQLPEMSRTRLLQAIPFALEEQLLDDVEALHFATAPRQSTGETPVAVINKSELRQYIERLASIGVTADVVMPVTLALPLQQDAWSALLDEQVVLRYAAYKGFSCEKENFTTFFELARAEVAVSPQKITFYCLQSCDSVDFFEQANEQEVRLVQQDQCLSYFASQLEAGETINLLQGEFAGKSASQPSMSQLAKRLSYLGGAFLLALLLYPLGSYIILKSRADKLNTSIHQIYAKHFPGSKARIAPRLHMEDKLRRLESGGGESQLFTLLGYIATDMSSAIQLQQFNYQNKRLNLQLKASNSEVLDKFTQALTAQGLKVRQQNVNVLDQGVTATLEIE